MKSLPSVLPAGMQPLVALLQHAKTQDECVRQAYDMLVQKYHGNRMKTYTHFLELFPRSMDELWARRGFLHCTNINWILKTLLVRSGHFSETDIQPQWTFLRFGSPHQFLRVRMKDGRRVNVDVWAHVFGIPFGDNAHGFHVAGRLV